MALNLWFEHVIDAYLRARAEGRDWREACAAAEPAPGPLRVLTQQDLKTKKGLTYTRQHLAKKVKGGAGSHERDPAPAAPPPAPGADCKGADRRQTIGRY